MSADVVIPSEFPSEDLMALIAIFRSGDLKDKWPEALGHFYKLVGWALDRGGVFRNNPLIIGDQPYTADGIKAIKDAAAELGIPEPKGASDDLGPGAKLLLALIIKLLSQWLLPSASVCICEQIDE